MDNDSEAAAKTDKEVEGWRIHYQSQFGRLPQLRSYKLPYLTQEPPVLTPRYQATASQEAALAPRARAPHAPRAYTHPIARLLLASRLPLRARSISEYKDELITPPPRLRFKSEINNIERRSGGVFITYNYNIVIRYLKDLPFTETLVGISLQLYNLWRL